MRKADSETAYSCMLRVRHDMVFLAALDQLRAAARPNKVSRSEMIRRLVFAAHKKLRKDASRHTKVIG